MTQKVIFLDTETTGLDFESDEIIQLSAITCDLDTQEVLSSINYFFEATKEVSPQVTAINGYYLGKWAMEGLPVLEPSAVSSHVLQYLSQQDSLIFCHNASFDRAFVSMFLKRCGIPALDQPKYFSDSATLAALFRMKSDWARVSLDYCSERLKVAYTRLKRHDSLDDCYLLKEVFFEFMKKIHVDKV